MKEAVLDALGGGGGDGRNLLISESCQLPFFLCTHFPCLDGSESSSFCWGFYSYFLAFFLLVSVRDEERGNWLSGVCPKTGWYRNPRRKRAVVGLVFNVRPRWLFSLWLILGSSFVLLCSSLASPVEPLHRS
ncbi:hypothetical protein LX32DRAFT_287399 [Colletotrichum zoysiae]|uniref:Uncharacterized protein n=1 Tax=Colletotrichum zoysiae TaxID=1216348 RepID=A0AAD9LUG7_9PEZI|nr:hypothetical protein LX32DRAFT_287399 [Colletotrichum zoysiae]